jgi:hypothetical protein
MLTIKTLKWFSISIFALGILVAACQGQGTSSTSPTAPQPNAVPTSSDLNEAEQRALEDLAKQLKIEPDEIIVKSVESVQWPDSCLGVQATGIMCSMIVTPGYRFVLEAQGQTYEYHTTRTGDSLVGLPELSLRWGSDDDCQQARLNYDQGISYGPCGGDRTTVPFPDPSQRGDLAKFSLTYHTFAADTAVGEIGFFGTGTQEALAVQERMIAEWGRQIVREVSNPNAEPGIGLVIQWSREGGIAGFCDELSLSIAGQVKAYSCKGTEIRLLGQERIEDDRLQRMYDWVDEFHSFELELRDNAIADPMTTRLNFRGRGEAEPTEQDQQDMLDFSSELYFHLSQSGAGKQAASASNPPKWMFNVVLRVNLQVSRSGLRLLDWNPGRFVPRLDAQTWQISQVGIEAGVRNREWDVDKRVPCACFEGVDS